MIETPRMTQERDGSYTIWDIRRVRAHGDWRFLGWLLVGATAAVVFYDVRAWRFATGPAAFLLPLTMAIAGAVLLMLSQRVHMVERPLLRVFPPEVSDDPVLEDEDGHGFHDTGFTVEHYAPGACHQVDVADLTHVVFGMIDYPWPGREGVAIEAFALYLAKFDGTPIPIIDGTEDKLAAYQIGTRLGEVLGLPMIQLGKGQ